MSNLTPEDIILLSFQKFAGKSPDEQLDPNQKSLGFKLLNIIINNYNANDRYITFLADLDFTMNPGVDEYLFAPESPPFLQPNQNWVQSNLLSHVYFLNFTYTDIMFPMRPIGKAQYYRQYKITNLEGFPTIYFLDKHPTYSLVRIYPKPITQFSGKMRGKEYINQLTEFTSIDQVPDSYDLLLIQELGQQLIKFYRLSDSFWTADDTKELERLRLNITVNNEWSCSIVTDGVLNTRINGWQRAVNGSVILGV